MAYSIGMETPATSARAGLVHAAIVSIMAEGPSVSKSRRNTQQNYQFRGIDDLYAELQPKLAHHSLHIYPHAILEDSIAERESVKDGRTSVAYHVRQRIEFRVVHALDGSWIPVVTTGEAIDHGGDKASNKAMSAALKYALIQTFLVTTGEDIDTENHSPQAGRQTRPGRAQRPPPGPPQAPPPDQEAPPAGQPAPAGADPDEVPIMGQRPGSQLWEQVGTGRRRTPAQQARMKILQKDLGVEDGPWREKIYAAYGKTSSSDLSDEEAEHWIGKLEASKRARSRAGASPT